MAGFLHTPFRGKCSQQRPPWKGDDAVISVLFYMFIFRAVFHQHLVPEAVYEEVN